MRDAGDCGSGAHAGGQAQRRPVRGAPGGIVGRGAAGAGRSGPGPGAARWWTTRTPGCVAQVGEQALHIGRNAVLAAGWPLSVPGHGPWTGSAGCPSSSVHFAVAGLISGQSTWAGLGGGRSSWSWVRVGPATLGEVNPSGSAFWRPAALAAAAAPGHRRRDGRRVLGTVPYPVRRVRRLPRTTRRPLPRTTAWFDLGQIAPVTLADVHDRGHRDEGVRRGSTLENLGRAQVGVLGWTVPIHAGNSLQMSDAAAALLMTTSARWPPGSG